MTKSKWLIILFLVACAGVSMVFAQRYSNRRYSNRRGVPDWESDRAFSHDVFTFVRIRYSSGYG
ncbi:MAG: transmembrane prediction, partial [Phycisphaerae bacterium]